MTYTLEQIFALLERQSFADFYNDGKFDSYIAGDVPEVTKAEALAELKTLLDRVR
jgi:hypothetical protein